MSSPVTGRSEEWNQAGSAPDHSRRLSDTNIPTKNVRRVKQAVIVAVISKSRSFLQMSAKIGCAKIAGLDETDRTMQNWKSMDAVAVLGWAWAAQPPNLAQAPPNF